MADNTIQSKREPRRSTSRERTALRLIAGQVYRALKGHLQPLDVVRAASVTGLSKNVVLDALVGLVRDGRARLVPGQRFSPVYRDEQP